MSLLCFTQNKCKTTADASSMRVSNQPVAQRSSRFVVAAVLTASQPTIAGTVEIRCEEAPPRPWRHHHCERWDCGDLGRVPERCRWLKTGFSCTSSQWNCSDGNALETLEADGGFACVSGQWAGILPQCLGDTVPGVRGTWRAVKRRVRAVLFKLNVSWSHLPTKYQPEICTTNALGLTTGCHRGSFGEVLENNLWAMLVTPLQDALCAPPETATEFSSCTGTVSQVGDKIRIAGVSGGPYNSALSVEAASAAGYLVIYLDAVPLTASGAEHLQSDIVALAEALRNILFQSSDLWYDTDIFDEDFLNTSAFPPRARWLRSGFSRLRSAPRNFGVEGGNSFKNLQWLPTLHIGISEPFVLNRYDVPDWQFTTRLREERTELADALIELQELQDVTVRVVCCFFAAIWVVFLMARFCLWSLLYGGSRPWGLRQSLRTFGILALVSDGVEVFIVFFIYGVTVWLSGYGVFDDAAAEDFRRPQLALLLLPIPLSIVFPLTFMTWQLVFVGKNSGDGLMPAKARVCCCRVRKRIWLRCLFLFIIGHASALIAMITFVSLRLARSGKEEQLPIEQEPAVAACNAELARLCTQDSEKQLPNFGQAHRKFCARDCVGELWPAIGILRHFEQFLYHVAISGGVWTLLTRLVQLYLAWSLDAARQRAKQQSPRDDRSSAKLPAQVIAAEAVAVAKAERAAAEAAILAAADALEEGLTLDGSPAEVAFSSRSHTPRATPRQAAASTIEETVEASSARSRGRKSSKSAGSEKSEDKLSERISEAVTMVDRGPLFSFDPTAPQPPPTSSSRGKEATETSGSARSRDGPGKIEAKEVHAGEERSILAFAQQIAGDESGKSAVKEMLAGEEKGILTFAQQIARQCSRDSFVSHDPKSPSGTSAQEKTKEVVKENSGPQEDLFVARHPTKSGSAGAETGARKKLKPVEWIN